MIATGTALLIGSIIAALAGAGSGIAQSAINAKSVSDTNKLNKEMQDQINAQNQYNVEHAHQIEMNDLQAAGLNPILTATGGNGAPMVSLQAAKAQAPQVDLSAIGSALQGVMSNMTMMTLLNEKNHLIQQQNQVMSDRNAVLADLYRRKADYLGTRAASPSAVYSAEQVHRAAKKIEKEVSDKEWKHLINQLR